MDDPTASRTLFSGRPSVTCGMAVLLFLSTVSLYTLGGCLSPPPRPLFRPTPASFAKLAQEIANFRGLPLKRAITLGPGFNEHPFGDDFTAPIELNHLEQAYKSIALLTQDADLARALDNFRRLNHFFSYDSARAIVNVAPAAAQIGTPFEITEPTLAREAPLGFAVVAALQEQNFHWQEKLRATFLEDHRLALRALATGDAVLTVIARAANTTDLTSADLARAGRFAGELEKSAARLPAFLRDQFAFSYREGSRFVLWALKAKGWSGVDALYDQPPVSTAALLHPEKYFLVGQQPLRFYPAALLRRAWDRLLVEQSLGEQLVRSLLAGSTERKGVVEITAEWRGDQLFAFRDGAKIVTAWYSAWTSFNDAVTFLRAYKTVLEQRQRIRFVNLSASAMSGRTRDGHGVWLAAQGPLVLFLSGISTERLGECVDDAWRDLEVDADSTDIRFESVRLEKHRYHGSLIKR